ncbi:MAG: hypothetical protein WC525_08930 [Candidatus Thermoplasmatota archaeon]
MKLIVLIALLLVLIGVAGCTGTAATSIINGTSYYELPLGDTTITVFNATPVEDYQMAYMAFRYTWKDNDEYIAFKPLSSDGDDTPIIFYRDDSPDPYVTYQFRTYNWDSDTYIGVSLKRGSVAYRAEYYVSVSSDDSITAKANNYI